MKDNLNAGKAYSSFKKNNGPPHTNWNASFDPIECNEYLLRTGVDIEALRSTYKPALAPESAWEQTAPSGHPYLNWWKFKNIEFRVLLSLYTNSLIMACYNKLKCF